ncbi:aldehyde dehydrogenase family protein [Candidatus Neomarinimicrobiota bacterium]
MSVRIIPLVDGRSKLECFNPSTNEPLQDLTTISLPELTERLVRSRAAATELASWPVKARVRCLRRFRRAMARNTDKLIKAICDETGKKPMEGLLEVFGALEIMVQSEKAALKELRKQRRASGTFVHKRGYIDYEPYGVATVISAWNYPLLLSVTPTYEALLAGNSAVVKPSEQTSLVPLLAQEIFEESTGMKDLYQVVVGLADVGEALVASPDTDIVCFIGSTVVGRKIAVAAAQQLKPVILELGGKDPMLVLEDANLDRAAKAAVWAGFTNAGQTCIAVERVYVVDKVYDKFIALLRKEAEKLTHGAQDEADIGSITLDVQYDKIQHHIDDARAKGAHIEIFGEPDGRHHPPVIVTDVDHTMDIMTDETFGPELGVMRVADEAEAIAKANECAYGLSGYVFTKSKARGRRIARQLHCGTVGINDAVIQYGMGALPIGGHKESGLGQLHGREGILNFSKVKSVVENRIELPVELWWYDMAPKIYTSFRRLAKTRYRW